jgi:hypothetical protein
MSQTHQMIGQISPELEHIAAEHQGWGPTADQWASNADTPESLGTEVTDASDYSIRDRRRNAQLQYLVSPVMAARDELPMAALQVVPAVGDD